MPHRKKKQMTEEELNRILSHEMRNSIGSYDEELSEDQGDAIDRYLGALYGTEVDGRSHYVSRDVMDTIEWIMPTLIDTYYSTDTPVVMEPQNEEDIPGAEQETAYTSYVINRRNDGFHVIHDFAKDGLLQKIGILKVFWEETESATEQVYENLTYEEMVALASSEDVQIIEHTAYLDGVPVEDAFDNPEATHDLRVTHGQDEGQVKIVNIPHEEFRVSKRAVNKQGATFMAHITEKTVSELLDMGFDDDVIYSLAEDAYNNSGEEAKSSPQYLARYQNLQTEEEYHSNDRNDLAMMTLNLEECYVRADWNNDGYAEIRQVFRIGKTILENEEIDDFPFVFWSPIMIPHRFIGLSIVDLVEDLQKLKTHLTRSMIDNINSANNGGYTILSGMVDIEDLLETGPLKIIRQKVPNAVQRLDQPNLPPEAFQMLSYLDKVRDDRTGTSPLQKGLDDSVLSSNPNAGATRDMMTAAQQKIQLITRIFAETGLKDLYRMVHKQILLHAPAEDVFRLNESFVTVNPAEWRERKDFIVTIGTGYANREQKMMHLQTLTQDLALVAQQGGLGRLITEQNIYNFMKEKFVAAGFKNFGQFISNPAELPEPQPSEAEQMQQAAIQQEMQLKQHEANLAEIETRIKAAEAQIKEGEAQVSAAKAAAEIRKIEHEARMEELNYELKRQELELEKQQGRGVRIG